MSQINLFYYMRFLRELLGNVKQYVQMLLRKEDPK